jgi:putative transposase
VWTSDITYIPTREGWLYVATVMDLYARRIVGWSMGDRVSRRLTIGAMQMALLGRRPSPGLIHHSDRGSQYACKDYREMLERNAIRCSMSRRGDCYDNAGMESFFSSMKREWVFGKDYQTRREAKADLFEYIEIFYNRRRRHSTLGYLSPAEFEERRNAA